MALVLVVLAAVWISHWDLRRPDAVATEIDDQVAAGSDLLGRVDRHRRRTGKVEGSRGTQGDGERVHAVQ